MLPIVLVLLVAQSALSVPLVQVTQNSINQVAPLRDPGSLVSNFLTEGAFDLIDGGETNVYVVTARNIISDLANAPDSLSQGLAIAQTINVLGELANGNPGDACEYAAIVNSDGNPAALAANLSGYVSRVLYNIDVVASLAKNPTGLRYAVGRKTGCGNAGRVYNFEAVWERRLSTANAYQIGLINEEYCNAKNLYNAVRVRNNNVGAALTAAAVDAVAEITQSALGPLANFLRAVASNSALLDQAAANAKQAVVEAASFATLA